MEINQVKSKMMVNSKNNQKANIYIEGISLENVEIFKYLGAILKVDGCSDNKLRICIYTAIMARLNIIWTSKNIHFKVKFAEATRN